MRDLVIFLAVLAGAVGVAILGGHQHWFNNQPGLVVLAYLGAVFAVIAVVPDMQSRRR